MRKRGAALLASMLLIAAAPLAAKPSALLRCDGFGRRDGAATGLARVPALLRSLGLVGSPEADDPRARVQGEAGLAACERALRDGRVRGDPVRRAEILLMRGIRRLERGEPGPAFGDAAAALSVPVTPRDAAIFARTVAVSARLLQAQARLAEGRHAEAEALAEAAIAARPFAPFLLREVLLVLAASPAVSPAAAELADRARRLTTRAEPALAVDPADRGRLATMALAWPRWEAPAALAGLGRDIARRPASVSIDRRVDGVTRVRVRRTAFIDSQYEAALLLAARLARERGADRLAIVDRGSGLSLGRSGLESDFHRLEFVVPGDPQWPDQAGRALEVAAVEATLAPVFPGVGKQGASLRHAPPAAADMLLPGAKSSTIGVGDFALHAAREAEHRSTAVGSLGSQTRLAGSIHAIFADLFETVHADQHVQLEILARLDVQTLDIGLAVGGDDGRLGGKMP